MDIIEKASEVIRPLPSLLLPIGRDKKLQVNAYRENFFMYNFTGNPCPSSLETHLERLIESKSYLKTYVTNKGKPITINNVTYVDFSFSVFFYFLKGKRGLSLDTLCLGNQQHTNHRQLTRKALQKLFTEIKESFYNPSQIKLLLNWCKECDKITLEDTSTYIEKYYSLSKLNYLSMQQLLLKNQY